MAKFNLTRQHNLNSNPSGDSVPFSIWLAVLGMNLGALMSSLDVTATNASLQDITGALSATLDQSSWIVTAYLIGEIIVVPLTGWFVRVFSTRWYMTGSTVFFLLSSIACANASGFVEMVAFRALQGFAAGAFVPVAMAYVLRHLPPSKHATGLAIFGLTVAAGPAVGPTLGGWLTYTYSWQYIFYLNLIPGALMLATCLFLIEREPVNLRLLQQGDWVGIFSMAIGLGCMQTVLEEGNRKVWFSSLFIVQLTIIAVVFICVFLLVNLTKKRPFINLRLLRRRNFALACLVNLVAGCGIFGGAYILPIFLDSVPHYTSYQVGLTLMSSGIGSALILVFLPSLEAKIDSRAIVASGIAIFAVSCFMNTTMTALTGTPQLILPQLIRGVGQSTIAVPLSELATSKIEGEQLNDASALFNQTRYLGGSFADAIFATLIQHRTEFHYDRLRGDISLYNQATQQRLQEMTQYFLNKGADMSGATQQAIEAISNLVQQQATVMAINDCCYLLGILMLLSGIALLFMKRAKVGSSMIH